MGTVQINFNAAKSDSVDHEALVCVGVQTGGHSWSERRTRRDIKTFFVCLTVCFDKGSLFLKTVHLSHWVCGELTMKTKTALRPSRARAGQSCFLSPTPLLVSKFSRNVSSVHAVRRSRRQCCFPLQGSGVALSCTCYFVPDVVKLGLFKKKNHKISKWWKPRKSCQKLQIW